MIRRRWFVVGWFACLALLVLGPARTHGQERTLPTLRWVAAGPDLVIGEDEADPRDDLFRVTGVAQLPDGRIVVINNGTREVLYFGATGTPLGRAGGGGDGPGELKGPGLVPTERYDSILVSDLPRVSVARADGSLERIGQMPPPYDLAGMLGGKWLLVGHEGEMADRGSQTGLRNSRVSFHLAERVEQPGQELLTVEYARFYKPTPTRSLALPLTVSPSFVVAGDRLLVTDGVSPEIRVISQATGSHVIRVPLPSRAVNRREFDQALASMSPERRRLYEGVPRPARYPIIARLVSDQSGGFWAQLYEPDATLQPRWVVFDRSDEAIGVLALPRGFTLWEVGPDFVLGVNKDEFDVERIERFQIRREGHP